MIYVLGDSFTYGQGVSNEHTWYNQLGELLNIKCYNINRQSIDWRKGDESEEYITASNYFLAKMLNKHLHKLTDIEMLIIQWTAPLRDSDIDEDAKFSHEQKLVDKINLEEIEYLNNAWDMMSDSLSTLKCPIVFWSWYDISKHKLEWWKKYNVDFEYKDVRTDKGMSFTDFENIGHPTIKGHEYIAKKINDFVNKNNYL